MKILSGILFSTLGFYLIIFICIICIISALLGSSNNPDIPSSGLSAEVEAYRGWMTQIAGDYDMIQYVDLLLAITQVESGGKAVDVMQSSECGFNTRYPRVPNSITDTGYSIECGVQQLRAAKDGALASSPFDIEKLNIAVQAYNFGLGFVKWALINGGYSHNVALDYQQKYYPSGGGDVNYVLKVMRYYPYAGGGGSVMDPEIYNKMMAEAYRHEGVPYVFGGYSPAGFDCSGFVCYVLNTTQIKNVGRLTAQGLYDMCTSIPEEEATPGDLVFYKNTYQTGDGRSITHVGFYIGDGRMYDASHPRISNHAIWQNYERCYGRIPLP